jgi:pantetheine-phosphate adenylyltransferase
MPDRTLGKFVTAVFSGTFDPITEGHVDIIRRGTQIFEKVIVAVGTNPEKDELFTKQERVEMIKELVSDMPDVEVVAYDGLTIDFVRKVGGSVILKGIRDTTDLHYELQQANTNRLAGRIETLFLLTGDRHALTSSSLIRQVAEMGGDISSLVPPVVAEKLRKRLVSNNKKV